MDNNISIQRGDPLLCDACFTKVNDADLICGSCGYPLKGNSKEQRKFIANKNSKEIDHDAYKKSLKISTTALYLVAASSVITGVLQYLSDSDEELKFYVLIINLIVAFIFVALGAWVRNKPLPAILIGATLYFTILALNMIYDPLTLTRNLVIKIAIVVVLIRGIVSAANIGKVKKELNIH
jgi:hypothetical protein